MSNHWHFVAWPEDDGQLSRFFGHLALLHATRWQVARNAVGTGHVYQGRFKNFMIRQDVHLLWVLRYVERNALRQNLVQRAREWRWGSLQAQTQPGSEFADLIRDGPTQLPRDWTAWVNDPGTDAEREAIERSLKRGRAPGDHSAA